ncbi:(2Fe-2S)-binding protein [Paenibacillus agricola]|uniref:(2Fe-2S)-binding protein n=1 Tax=Paenibacillus agricola TaxID=2716264 RepID=A0ABX0J0P0_9BACL|nr:(2Fe-2S)-binding protein [Paenibacillus agricola]NHN29253.1 (2Fe-2S)-binding protein [Paenibacillus agricola]
MAGISFDRLEQQMFFAKEAFPEQAFRVEMADLLKEGNAKRFVGQYGPVLKAMKPEVAATYFSLWFAWVCVAMQYTISHDHATYDFSLRNLKGQVHLVNGRPRWAFLLHDADSLSTPAGDRNAWRKQVLTSFYALEVAPLLTSIAEAADIGVGQLWGQVATRMHYAQDAFLREATSTWVRQTIEEDFACLQQELDGEVFGRKRNPFDINFRLIDNPRMPEEPYRIKASCCLAYLTDTGHGYCYTCPRMGEEEREEKRQKLVAAVQASN